MELLLMVTFPPGPKTSSGSAAAAALKTNVHMSQEEMREAVSAVCAERKQRVLIAYHSNIPPTI